MVLFTMKLVGTNSQTPVNVKLIGIKLTGKSPANLDPIHICEDRSY